MTTRPATASNLARSIHKVIGPPGTGKTTFLVREAVRAAQSLRDGNKVLVTSLTKAAALEFASRIPSHLASQIVVGTLHSHAYRALGGPTGVQLIRPEDIAEWNASEKRTGGRFILPRDLLSSRETDAMDTSTKCEFWQEYHVCRAFDLPREKWESKRAVEFAELFDPWKQERDVVDFTDLIELAIETYPAVSPQYLFVDEAQDHDALQWRLIKQWSLHPQCENLVLVGDPAQNLYEWRGSEATAMEMATEGDQSRVKRTVLSKSYRVPKSILGVAVGIRNRMTDIVHDEYDSRDGDEGNVSYIDADILKDAREIGSIAEKHVDTRRAQSMMVLATCGFMLDGVISELRSRGIPYCNPFKSSDMRLNPFGSPPRGISWLQRVEAFLAHRTRDDHTWTAHELSLWVGLMKVSTLLKHGQGAAISRIAESSPREAIGREELRHVFFKNPDEADALFANDGEWLSQWCRADYEKRLAYAFRVEKRYNWEFVHYRNIILGTIHSVKGGEADHVYLSNLMSMRERESYCMSSNGENQVHRKFYVGVTRARFSLTILGAYCGPTYSI